MDSDTVTSITELSRLSGTTSRTLRHYDAIGLLPPSHTGDNGYRYYDQGSLVRLQRILLLRELGLGLPAIADILDGQRDDAEALASHLGWLEAEKHRLDRQIAAVESTITRLKQGDTIMADEAFDGFDHTAHKEEVEQRWGRAAYAAGDRWWKGLSVTDKEAFQAAQRQIQDDYAAARLAGEPVDGELVQAITARHHEWIAIGWQGREVSAEALRGLGQMYVDDPRFAANYGGQEGAEYVRGAMAVRADRMDA